MNMNTSLLLGSSIMPHDLVANAAMAGPEQQMQQILVGLLATTCGVAASNALHRVVSGIAGYETESLERADAAANRSFGAAIPNTDLIAGVYLNGDTTKNYRSGFIATLSLSALIQFFADSAAFASSQDQGTALAITTGMAVFGGFLPTFLMRLARGQGY